MEQIRADYRAILKPRELTVREWLEDVRKRDAMGEPLDLWEPDAVRLVLPYLIAVCDEAREAVRYSDEEAFDRLHRSLRFLSAPVAWLRGRAKLKGEAAR